MHEIIIRVILHVRIPTKSQRFFDCIFSIHFIFVTA